MDTYTQATEKFLKSADWLEDSDAPMVTSLRRISEELDNGAGSNAALLNTYGVCYRTLMKRSTGRTSTDEAEDFLNSL